MKSYHKALIILALQFVPMLASADKIQVNSLSYGPQQGRVSVAVSASPKHRVFVMDNPSRLVIDIKNALLTEALHQPPANHPLFAKVRLASEDETGLRLVVDLKKPISPEQFSLSSNNRDGHRLIVELANKPDAQAAGLKAQKASVALVKPVGKAKLAETKLAETKAVETKLLETKAVETKPIETKKLANPGRDVVIAIDAGHGGNDPGAHGPQGTEEKNITLAIAQKLAQLIGGQEGMKAVMVRKDDSYIGLRERIQIARAAKADLFISIHADAFNDDTVRGASVYTLSTQGATSEAARWLEKSENASELVGGVNLSDKEDVLASVLLDLSQTATLSASEKVARSVLKHFDRVNHLHRSSVQKAGFMVLKAPDIPSILVETAFISNPLEEHHLLSTHYQNQTAKAIFQGVFDYFKESAPMDSRMAAL